MPRGSFTLLRLSRAIRTRLPMSRRVYLLLCPLLLVALPAPASAAAGPPPRPAAPVANPPSSGPRLVVADRIFDFGTVQKGVSLRHDFVIHNRGNAPLEISDVRPACGCTTAAEWTRTLAPGASGSIPLKFDSAQFSGPVIKTVSVISNDPATPETVLEIKGIVRSPVMVSNPVIIFPALTDPTQSATRSVTIRHEVEGTLKLTDLSCDKPQFKPLLKEIVPGKEFELQVTTVPPFESGTHTARIALKTSNAEMPTLTVQAVVTVLPAVQIAPTELMFPIARLAAPEKRYVVVLNHRGGDLQVTDLETNARGVEFAVQRNPDGRQFTITLNFPAGFDASAGDKLYFRGKTNHPGTPTFSVPIVFAGQR